MSDWQHVFAATLPSGPNKTLYSLQFFDSYGEAIHKIYSTNDSDIEAYFDIVERYRHPNQSEDIAISDEPRAEETYAKDEEIELDTFRSEWENMEDTHHFFGMLRKHKLHRLQALRLAPQGWTYQVPNDTVIQMLHSASERKVPIMVFVGNRGCIQIHSGEVNKILPMETWINVMDPMFNLHLNTAGIAQTWVVKKNTNDGIVTSLELFDASGELVVYFFGERKPGKPELESWRSLVDDLTAVSK